MKRAKRVASGWCMMRDSGALRTVIKYQMKAQGISASEVCRRASEEIKFSIHPANFRNYLTGAKKNRVTQADLAVICRHLGIKVGIKIETL